jgi:hypothetical protein
MRLSPEDLTAWVALFEWALDVEQLLESGENEQEVV